MHPPPYTRTVTVRTTLFGVLPEIWREIEFAYDAKLTELRDAVRTVFSWPSCTRHVFTDHPEEAPWSRRRHRWGDRMTMIDYRDPTVVEESTARIGPVLRDHPQLVFAHSCDPRWSVLIEAVSGDVPPAGIALPRVVAGERRSPLTCARDPYEHEVLVGVLDDPVHPQHEAMHSRIQSTLGPWASFDAEEFSIDRAQAAIQDAAATPPRRPLDDLVARLPSPAREGLRGHIASTALDMPVVVTADEAAAFCREIRWAIDRASTDGVALFERTVDPSVAIEGAAALHCTPERVRQIFAAMLTLHLAYRRSGRLVVKRAVLAQSASPIALWTELASGLMRLYGSGFDPVARDLFLLALADGSLADPAAGGAPAAQAYRLTRTGARSRLWGYDDDTGTDDCSEQCRCPRIAGASWHDIVVQCVRDAAAEVATDGADTVASQGSPYDDPYAPWTWLDEQSTPRLLLQRERDDAHETPAALERELLNGCRALIEVLALFGLERSPDGGWVVAPLLREFALAALHSRSASVRSTWDARSGAF
ncbi:plasmid pRiA4b ORF-3 family protein [Microbacterium fluvii]|uniref:Plasmid pRiA4b ORF-3 family protein n=1 Tax=Microbacterium fluvii TaxID=415215 RepID=A0ABW2HDQ4_9MICO|nr:plasmid pRiA4b ORF-3 family protein [Microbacterium fluvii]MCU4671673.1 plasmid pRiA4b ORF-3 family protein [Microbacterium fluvii]